MSLTQQKRLYEAEGCLIGHGRYFSSIREVTDYLNDIMATDWFTKQYGYLPSIQVRNFSSGKWAGCADRNKFFIYLKVRTEHIVLHELCHLLNSTDDHDHEFVNNFRHLIRNAMGFYAWAEFTEKLKKVDYYGA